MEEICTMKKGDSSIYWVIDFKNSETDNNPENSEFPGIPPFDLYIPQDTSAPPRPKRQKSRYKALEFLQQIQDSCESLKDECNQTLERQKEEPYEEQILNITEDIQHLFGIIKEFTQLMQKLQKPPEDPTGQDKKNS